MHGQVRQAARCIGSGLVVLALAQPLYAVDGVTEINQVRATAGGVTSGDSPGFPVTLNHPGSYRLTGNLTVSTADTTAIVISSDNVTLDLNGFTISCSTGVGPCSSGNGVGIDAGQDNVTIIHGTVRDMGKDGIVAGADARIERVSALANHHYGILVGAASTLTANTANSNGYDGLGCGASCTITGNTARNNTRGGIETNSDCTLSQNTTNNNSTFGIYCNGGCTIDYNTANGNGTGISLLGGNAIVGNTARNNTNSGIVAIGADSGYSLNTLTGNNGGGNAAQVSGGTPIGANFCGTDTGCP
jgi:parallel beta-helix repeat protein